jgi:hypothetical protein
MVSSTVHMLVRCFGRTDKQSGLRHLASSARNSIIAKINVLDLLLHTVEDIDLVLLTQLYVYIVLASYASLLLPGVDKSREAEL